jgi:hypothetical protein
VHDIEVFAPDHESVQLWITEEQKQQLHPHQPVPDIPCERESAFPRGDALADDDDDNKGDNLHSFSDANLVAKPEPVWTGSTTAAPAPVPVQPPTGECCTAVAKSIQEQAFECLRDLGMIEPTPDPNDPSYDHSTDDDICPDNRWQKP